MLNKRYVLISLGLIFLFFVILIPLIFYFTSLSTSQNTIEIVNGSKYYSVQYKDKGSKKLSEYLEEWNFWGEDNVYLEIDRKKHTIKRIKVYTSDTVQPYYQLKEGSILRSSVSERVDDKGTLHIRIYINPNLISIWPEEAMSSLVLATLVHRLYSMTHYSQSDEEKLRAVNRVISDLTKDKNKDPFEFIPKK